MNATIIVSLVAAIAAIIAPVVSSLINNHYQLKVKKLELYEERRIKIINDYISSVSKCIQSATDENIRQHRINHNSGRNDKEKVSTIQRRHINISNYQSQGALNQTVRFFLSARYRFATANII